MRIQDVIRRPLITEKSTELRDTNVIAFEVALHANKIQIKKAVEAQFQRKVSEVRVARFAEPSAIVACSCSRRRSTAFSS